MYNDNGEECAICNGDVKNFERKTIEPDHKEISVCHMCCAKLGLDY